MKILLGDKFSLTATIAAILTLMFITGCETIDFYGQAISGQLSLLANRTPIEDILESPNEPAELKTRLKFILSIRSFAKEELYLPTGNSYKSYVELSRPYVLWNVFAAPEFSLIPVSWQYPFVGRMSYRGYFRKKEAEEAARVLENNGYDVYVGGVAAYSSLGWFDDPVTSSMLRRSNIRLASLIFHETAHRLIFIDGDTPFNEGFATAVATEGVRRWINKNGATTSFEDFLAYRKRHSSFIDLVMSHRSFFEDLYKMNLPDDEKRERKKALFEDLRQSYAALKQSWGDRNDFDRWFEEPLNNAKLASIASYQVYAPAFAKILRSNNGDLEKFYKTCAKLGAMPKKERSKKLDELISMKVEEK